MFEEMKREPWFQTAKHIVLNTRIEIFAGLFAVGSLAGLLSYQHKKKEEAHIPVAFSEVESIKEKFSKKGEPVPALTLEYAVSNDVVMKVFEASNDALEKGEDNETFARELEKRIDPSHKEHALISEYAQEFPEITKRALHSMSKPIEATRDLPNLVEAFNDAWDDSHIDHYRTEFYTVTVCSGSGNSRSCHSEPRTRRVYDYTTHTYTFHKEEAVWAAQILSEFLQKHPDLDIGEHLERATETHEANQHAILKSMADLFKDKTPTYEDYLKLANTWATGSNFTVFFPGVMNSHRSLSRLSPAWESALNTAESQSYRTYRRFDAGPKEFQLAEAAIENGVKIAKGTKSIVDGITFAGEKVPELNAKIKEFVDVTLHGKEGDADKLREEIMDTARAVYKKNFEKGFDVYPLHWGVVVLLTLGGAVIGGLAGAGLDSYLNRRKEEWEVEDRNDRWKRLGDYRR